MKTKAMIDLDKAINNMPDDYSQELHLCYVYLIAESEDGPTKIGVSNNVKRRLYALQISNPRTLKCYGARPFITTAEAFDFEAALHDTFSEYHLRGEWFDIPARHIAMKVRIKYGKPDTKEQLMEKAILRGIITMPEISI